MSNAVDMPTVRAVAALSNAGEGGQRTMIVDATKMKKVSMPVVVLEGMLRGAMQPALLSAAVGGVVYTAGAALNEDAAGDQAKSLLERLAKGTDGLRNKVLAFAGAATAIGAIWGGFRAYEAARIHNEWVDRTRADVAEGRAAAM